MRLIQKEGKSLWLVDPMRNPSRIHRCLGRHEHNVLGLLNIICACIPNSLFWKIQPNSSRNKQYVYF